MNRSAPLTQPRNNIALALLFGALAAGTLLASFPYWAHFLATVGGSG